MFSIVNLLAVLGPVGFALRRGLPSLQTLKALAIGTVVVAVLGAGGYAGWTLHAWGEAPRIAKAQREAVARAELEARLKAKEQALAKKTATLEERERSLAETDARNKDLNETLEKLRAQSYDPDAPVLLWDDPWLRDRPAAGAGVGRADRGR